MDEDAIRAYVKEQIAFLKEFQIQGSAVGDRQPLFSNEEDAGEDSLELESLDGVELALAIETEFNLGTPEDIDIKRFGTVDEIVEFVVELLGQTPEGNG
jgi:acyl carrier protein